MMFAEPEDTSDESFELIPSHFDIEAEEPDKRRRPHRSVEAPLKCPNCDEQTLSQQHNSKVWSCPCGYSEER